jgi:tetratricopeptide (TPR) repeat protein
MQEESIFIEALEKEDAERRAYLERVCGSNLPLRQRIERLLERHQQGGSFLDAPAMILTPPSAALTLDGPGTLLGRYKLLEPIGEGGFGVVFRAEQQAPLHRTVALKIIKPGMDSQQVIARFEAERQALALMDHPNIARVLDAGTTATGRPYFVMELVQGVPITDCCEQQHVALDQRLALFVDVCHAVQHAHQKGIIHRDLKPSNILVTRQDDAPVVKVIDFGIAKALGEPLTDKTLQTGVAQLVGTPLYMSPEQAALGGLDVDTRSDIYALGVLLYELLTGTTPFDRERLQQAGYDELRRIIGEEAPPTPSTRLRSGATSGVVSSFIPHPSSIRELDWVVMKALEKDRNRRYESASALAADVQHYLNDEPVSAGPPSAWYRFRKFAQRNRGRLTTVAVVAAALLAVIGVLAASIGWVLRDQEARRVVSANQVTAALNEARTLQQQQQWAQALAAVKRAEVVMANGGDTEQREHAQEMRDDIEMAARLDALRAGKLPHGDGSFRHGDPQTARAYADAFKAYGLDVHADPPADVADRLKTRRIREQLLAGLDDWMVVQPDRAVRERLRVIAERADADVWRNRMRLAVVANDRRALEELAAQPEVADFPPATAHLLGQALGNLGAGAHAVKVLAAAQRRHPGDFYLNYRLGLELFGGTGVRHDYAAAAGYFRAALVARPDYATVHIYLGLALPGPEHVDEVVGLYRKAVELAANYATARIYLANALTAQGKLDEAVVHYKQALRTEPNSLAAHFNLAVALDRQGKYEAAIAEYRQALVINPKHADAHNHVGIALTTQGKLDEAVAHFKQALETDPDSMAVHFNLAFALDKQGKHEAAIAEYRQALVINPKYAQAHNNIGNALLRLSRFDAAIVEYRRALAIDPKFALAHNNIGFTFARQGKFDQAIEQYRQALTIDAGYVKARENLGNVLLAQGKRDEGMAEYDRAIQLASGPERTRLRVRRAIKLVMLKEHVRATAEADQLARAPDARVDTLYDAACVFARAAAVVRDDAWQREQYAGRAVELLRHAVERGWHDAEHTRADSDLAILRDWDDFRKLLADLAARAKPNR